MSFSRIIVKVPVDIFYTNTEYKRSLFYKSTNFVQELKMKANKYMYSTPFVSFGSLKI